MKVISVWQPWANLIVLGHKGYETRSWPAPADMIGQRIGIASTKQLKAEQRTAAQRRTFQKHYQMAMFGWNCPSADMSMVDMYGPLGCIVGTAKLVACHKMTSRLIKAVGARERNFGNWKIGDFAWLLVEPIALSSPIPVRGQQGVWNYEGPID
jgi:hypothetical protein